MRWLVEQVEYLLNDASPTVAVTVAFVTIAVIVAMVVTVRNLNSLITQTLS